jgi:hypothetical protein
MRLVCILILTSLVSFSCTKEIIQHKLSVSVSPINGGSVTPPSNSYEKGQSLQMLATPTGEYIFKEWKGDLTGTSNPTTLVIDKDKQVTGSFEKRQYPLILTIEGSGTVKEEIIAVATQSQYPSGTTVRLTPQPLEGWAFTGWSGDLTSTTNPLDLKIDKAITLKATFGKLNITSLKIENPIDTLIISKKYKFIVSCLYSNGTKSDISNLFKITNENKLTTIQNDQTVIGAKSGKENIVISYLNQSIKIPLFINDVENVEIPAALKSNGNCNLEVPVLIINYFPTNDGIIHDDMRGPTDWFNYYFPTLEFNKNMLLEHTIATKKSIEEGTRFRDYGKNEVKPYVCMNVVKYINLYDLPLVPWPLDARGNRIDYKTLFKRLNIEYWVNEKNVKEIWFGGYQNFGAEVIKNDPKADKKYFWGIPESNMASPLTSDISNSFRENDDLPIYNKTYIVYALIADDGVGSSLHCRGHQIEVMLDYLDKSPSGNRLFVNNFTGQKNGTHSLNGRAGNTHFPPNATRDYDYENKSLIKSDIMMWQPSGGTQQSINSDNWFNVKYKNINFLLPHTMAFKYGKSYYKDWTKFEAMWHIFWNQSIPGQNNNIDYNLNGQKYKLRNWWELFYNWDDAIKNKKTLWVE